MSLCFEYNPYIVVRQRICLAIAICITSQLHDKGLATGKFNYRENVSDAGPWRTTSANVVRAAECNKCTTLLNALYRCVKT